MTYGIAQRTFGQVNARVALALGKRYDVEFTADGAPVISGDLLISCKEIINRAQVRAQDVIGLEKLRQRYSFGVKAPVTSGATIAISNNSATVTFSAISILTSADIGRYIRINDEWFRITAVTTGPPHTCTIESAFQGDAITAGALEVYTVFHELGTINVNMMRTVDKVMYPGQGKVELVDLDDIEDVDPEWDNIGSTPVKAAFVRHNKVSALRFDILVDTADNFFVYGVRYPTNLTADADVSDLPEVHHSLWEGLACYMATLYHGSEEQQKKQLANLRYELRSMTLEYEPEVDFLTRFGQVKRSIVEDIDT